MEEKRTFKIFISQPMRGLSDEEIKKERNRAINAAKHYISEDGKDVEVIDSFLESAPVDAKPLWFLGKSLQFLSSADLAYFVKGYDKARGCKLEYEAAKAYGITVISEE